MRDGPCASGRFRVLQLEIDAGVADDKYEFLSAYLHVSHTLGLHLRIQIRASMQGCLSRRLVHAAVPFPKRELGFLVMLRRARDDQKQVQLRIVLNVTNAE